MGKHFSLLLGVVCSIAISRASEVPLLRHFTKEDYQAQHQNWSVTSAPDGRIYAGNNAGLLAFDGCRWQLYELPNKQTVRTVICTASGRLFTGGFASFGYWQYNQSGELQYHALDSLIRHPLFDKEEIWKILEVGDSIFFQSFSSLYVFHAGKVELVPTPGNIMYLQRVGKQLILPVLNQGLFRWERGEFRMVPGSDLFARKRIAFIIAWQNGWLIGTSQSGLYFYKHGVFAPLHQAINEQFRQHQINSGQPLQDGSLAIGTISHGVYVLNADLSVKYNIHQENGLQNNTVLGMHEDHYRDLWVAMDKGLDLIAVNSSLLYYQDKQGDLGSVYASAVFNHDLYLGTNHGLFYCPWPNPEDRPFRMIDGSQGQVWDIQAMNDQLLIGHNDGTFRVKDHQWTPVSSIAGGWQLIPVPGHPEWLLQATYTGLVIYTWQPEGWVFSHRITGFPDPVKRIVFDHQARLWGIGPNKGLYRFWIDEDWQQVTQIKTYSDSDGLHSSFHLRLELRDGELEVGTDTGWLVWSESEQRLVSRPEDVSGYLPGRQGDYFLTYADHVAYYRNGELIQRFPVHLIPGYERIIPVSSTGYLFCLEDGYALLNQSYGEQPPPQTLDPVLSMFSALDDGSQRLIRGQDVMTFRSNHNNLQILFYQPYFRRGPQFRFRYGDVSSELNWGDWSSEPSALMTNLQPGTYRFELMSNLSPTIASVEFSIAKPWYQRGWALVLFLMILTGILYGLQRYHAFRLEIQRRKLELEKTRKLQQQEIRARNEQLQQAIINKSKELANTTVNLIRKNEILTQLKDEIQIMQREPMQNLARHEQQLIHLIDHHLSNEKDWELFESNFNQVHEAFLKKLYEEHPQLTPGELRLAAYLKMNLSTKEIAPLLNISVRGVENKRYRLRQKLGLRSDDNLTEYLWKF
ncbi:MAG: hypothetical protein KDC57_18340 [Saprospiraceae bacterium]|nr:hypothetical protein [Saprospiraceae bacterium]